MGISTGSPACNCVYMANMTPNLINDISSSLLESTPPRQPHPVCSLHHNQGCCCHRIQLQSTRGWPWECLAVVKASVSALSGVTPALFQGEVTSPWFSRSHGGVGLVRDLEQSSIRQSNSALRDNPRPSTFVSGGGVALSARVKCALSKESKALSL